MHRSLLAGLSCRASLKVTCNPSILAVPVKALLASLLQQSPRPASRAPVEVRSERMTEQLESVLLDLERRPRSSVLPDLAELVARSDDDLERLRRAVVAHCVTVVHTCAHELSHIEDDVRYWNESLDSKFASAVVFGLFALARGRRSTRQDFYEHIGALRAIEGRALQFVGRVYLSAVDLAAAKPDAPDLPRKLLATATGGGRERSLAPLLGDVLGDGAEALRDYRAALRGLLAPHRRPGHVRRHWLTYTVGAAVAAAAARFLYRHSALNGSEDLERWVGAGRGAAAAFAREHVVAPLHSIYRELFTSLRQRSGTAEDFEGSRRSLAAMIESFGRSTAPALEAGALREQAERGDMSVVMKVYEQELERPLVNAVAGDLLRALLIQIQKVKVESEAAMLQMDQILRANEINIELLATIPALLLAACGPRPAPHRLPPTSAAPQPRVAERRDGGGGGPGGAAAGLAAAPAAGGGVGAAGGGAGAGAGGEGRAGEGEGERAAGAGRLLVRAEQLERALEGLVSGSARAAMREDLADLRDPALPPSARPAPAPPRPPRPRPAPSRA
eukprot:tig00020780_g13819.t1